MQGLFKGVKLRRVSTLWSHDLVSALRVCLRGVSRMRERYKGDDQGVYVLNVLKRLRQIIDQLIRFNTESVVLTGEHNAISTLLKRTNVAVKLSLIHWNEHGWILSILYIVWLAFSLKSYKQNHVVLYIAILSCTKICLL